MSGLGLELARESDIAEAHALAVRTVVPPVATAETLRSMHEHTGSTVFVMREDERVTGVVAELPLTHEGLLAVQAARFNGLEPHPTHVARPGQNVAAFYCWGCAAETRRAAAATVKAVVTARNQIYPELPFFTRAALPRDGSPEDGSKGAKAAMRRFGCDYYPGQPDLLYSPKSQSARRDAA